MITAGQTWRPRQDSNLRSRLRRAVLYPLSYGGQPAVEGTATRSSTPNAVSVSAEEIAVARRAA